MSFLKPPKTARGSGWGKPKAKVNQVQLRASSSAYWARHQSLYPDEDAWKAKRSQAYLTYKGKCLCGVRLRGPLYPDGADWQLDHRRELSSGGKNVAQNLRPLCLPCHHRKTLRNRQGD